MSVAISTEKKDSTYCSIQDMAMFSNVADSMKLENRIADFLKRNGFNATSIDAVVLSNSGNAENDTVINELRKGLFADTVQITYKNISGEFYASSAFGFGLRLLR